MIIRQIRNATLSLEVGEHKLLVDPAGIAWIKEPGLPV
ncbi:MAG: hypothetical protein ACI8QC_003290 [Planctomycetota bacterium]|jgi:hypothetical protein